MAIKGKKRPVENAAVSGKTEVQQQLLKKKVKVEKVTKPATKSNGLSATKPVKMDKTNKKVSEVKRETGVAPAKTEKINKKVELKRETGVAPVKTKKTNKKVSGIKLDNGVAPVKSVKAEKSSKNNEANINESTKLAALIEQKAKKREIKKQKLASYEPDRISETVEELEAKIESIKSREVITNAARRRLGVLRKKLRIKQGTYQPPTSSKPETQGMTKAEKRKYRRQRAALKKRENNVETKSEALTEVKSIAKDAANAVKGIKTKVQDKKQLQNTKIFEKKGNNVDKKVKPGLNKVKAKNEKAAVLPETKKNKDDDDEDDDEDEEDEDESMNVSNNSTNTLDSNDDYEDADDDDDDDDEEDDEDEDADDDEEEKVEIKKPINKSKNDSKQNTKSDTNGMKNEKLTKNSQHENSNASPKKSRYVLFIGNLPYTATVDDIKNHFLTKVNEVVSVRIPQSPQNTPRGFAYVEFANNIDYEKGLSLHESNLNGRRINVQYSQSGSKNVGKRPNVVAKNQKLHALRKQGKLAGSTKDSQKRNARRNKGKNQAA